MVRLEIKEGNRYNNLVVIREVELKGTKRQFEFKCDCGNIKKINLYEVKSGKIKSCGCILGKNRKTHGHSIKNYQSPTYISWCMMKQRCLNPNHPYYHNYGGRGITICERWLKFENFLEDISERPEGTTLDRIDGNKGYEPTNCRWATYYEQTHNRRKRNF